MSNRQMDKKPVGVTAGSLRWIGANDNLPASARKAKAEAKSMGGNEVFVRHGDTTLSETGVFSQ